MKATCIVLIVLTSTWLILPGISVADSELEVLKQNVATQEQAMTELKKMFQKLSSEHEATKTELQRLASEQMDATQVGKVVEAFNSEPSSKFLVTGYASTGFEKRENNNSSFDASFSPGFHFRLNDNLHVSAELEISVADEKTETELEFVQADYFAHDNLILSAGKMLLPFNAFGERLHPQWINKLPSLPVIYGAHGGDGVSPGIIPILTDIGIQAHGGVELGNESMAKYALYLVNGPQSESGMEGEEAHDKVELAFGESGHDNNNNKAFGGRVGILPISGVEIGWSGLGGKYRDNEGFFVWGSDAEFHYGGLELRAEYLDLAVDRAGLSDQNQNGFYGQVAYRLGRSAFTSNLPQFYKDLEFVGRYGSAETTVGTIDQLQVGFDYWVAESAPLKFAYEFNSGEGDLSDDRLLTQFSYGF